jgi:hypothetical protein
MLVTPLKEKYGYDRAAKVAKNAHKNGTTLKAKEALALRRHLRFGRRLRRHRRARQDDRFPSPKKCCNATRHENGHHIANEMVVGKAAALPEQGACQRKQDHRCGNDQGSLNGRHERRLLDFKLR